LWRHDSGQVYIWEMNGLGIKAEGGVVHAPVPNDWHVQGVGDFDADGKSDILWRHDSGQVYIWEMDSLGVKAEGGVVHAAVPNDYHIQASVTSTAMARATSYGVTTAGRSTSGR